MMSGASLVRTLVGMERAHPATDAPPGGRGRRGILAPATRLDRWLDIVLVGLVLTSALRYAGRHDLDVKGLLVLGGAALFVVLYLARPLLPDRSWWPTVWVAILVVVWMALTLAAPSFAWTAVPLAFAALEVLAFPYALAVVVLMTVVVSTGWLRITDGFDPTLVAGPIGIALVTVFAYRTLEQESLTRQRLLDELVAAHEDLAAAQHRSGALAERTRLSREIHDSVGQGLSSINLLLNAAEQDWDRRPDVARSHVRTAAGSARSGLDEVRRVVRNLAPVEIDGQDAVDALPAALSRIAAQTGSSTAVEVRVHGAPTSVPEDVATAIVRTTRGALANVTEHAAARHAVISLTYNSDEVLLDVRDDGTGMDPRRSRAAGLRGRGLRGIAERAESLGGRATVESAPGEGTTVSVAFPLDGAGRA
jgi:signal transduction histidine kinase